MRNAQEFIESPLFQSILAHSKTPLNHVKSFVVSEPESIAGKNSPYLTKIASTIDHTLLSPTATQSQIQTICQEAIQHHFKAVCVHPVHVEFVVQYFEEIKQRMHTTPKVAVVIGFPLGQNTSTIKLEEAKEMLKYNVHELDVVINLSKLVDGDYEYVVRELTAIVKEANKVKAAVKVIIESGLLRRDFDQEKIEAACICCIVSGAHCVKTSTGFLGTGASEEDVRLMYDCVAPFGMWVKASGGIRDRASAVKMLRAGASRIGASKGVQIVSGGSGSNETESSY